VYACTHARTRMYTHARTHARAHSRTHTHTHSSTHAHTLTHTHIRTHIHTVRTRARAHTHTHTHSTPSQVTYRTHTLRSTLRSKELELLAAANKARYVEMGSIAMQHLNLNLYAVL
jgi:hypothetical protein